MRTNRPTSFKDLQSMEAHAIATHGKDKIMAAYELGGVDTSTPYASATIEMKAGILEELPKFLSELERQQNPTASAPAAASKNSMPSTPTTSTSKPTQTPAKPEAPVMKTAQQRIAEMQAEQSDPMAKIIAHWKHSQSRLNGVM